MVAIVATPLVINALHRVTPSSLPGWFILPFLAVVSGSVWLGVRHRHLRTVSAAVLASSVVYGAFLLWLVSQYASVMDRF